MMARPKSSKDTFDDLKLSSSSQRYTEKELKRLDATKANEREFQMARTDIFEKINRVSEKVDAVSKNVATGNKLKITSFIALLVAIATAGTFLGMTTSSVAETQKDIVELGTSVEENSAQISELKKTVEDNQKEVLLTNNANLVSFKKTVEDAIGKLDKKKGKK
jgi:cell division protein FtsL